MVKSHLHMHWWILPTPPLAAWIVCDIFVKPKYKLPSSNESILPYWTLRNIRIEINYGSHNVLSFNMEWRILVNFIRRSMSKLPTHSGFHDLFLKYTTLLVFGLYYRVGSYYSYFVIVLLVFLELVTLWSWQYFRWIYNHMYMYNQCLPPLKLWVRIMLMTRFTRYSIMW
jgi:hypothetical protein